MSTKITFIGAGIATSYTLIPFLENLENNPTKEKIELVIIDRSKDFFKGMPYGNRSGKSVLLIQDLKNFITEPHRTHFKNWLNKQIKSLSKEFIFHGGPYANKWIIENKQFIEDGDWDDLYIPRFFFGTYIEEEVLKRIKKLESSNKLLMTYLQKETIGLQQISSGFKINFEDSTSIITEKVVLSMGSLPYKRLFEEEIKNPENALYIKEPYGSSMEQNLTQIEAFVKARKKNNLKTKITVLGANASGLEAVYKICDRLPMDSYDMSFKTLSSHGLMPDGTPDLIKAKEFSASHLEALEYKKNITAALIGEAAHKDIDEAENQDLGAATTVGIISAGFGTLLPKLSRTELLNFAYFHGNQIGRRQRCAGNHYLSVIEELKYQNKFEHIKGRFVSLEESTEGLLMKYKPTDSNSNTTEKTETFNVVVNCLGSVNLDSENLTPLLEGLIKDGLCKPNPSKIGFHVDDKMQAIENLYVAGPLLAGNQIEDKIFWHLEHCARIIWSSDRLSKNLISGLN
jgi:uncharacterized NAD(P)/FAD-binding protein YdhS